MRCRSALVLTVAVAVAVAVVVPTVALAIPARPARAGFAPPLDRPVPLGGGVVLRGELRSSLDGSTFDAITTRDNFPRLPGDREPRLEGLFDPAAGGLRVIEQDLERHQYRLAPTGEEGRACREAGVESPCLAPRLATLAHQRLVTAEYLAATLSGQIEAEVMAAPPLAGVGLASGGRPGPLLSLTASLAALLGVGLWVGRARRERAHPGAGEYARVRTAARQARRALRGEPTLARARAQIDAVVERARDLEQTRRACEAGIERLNLAGLDARRAALTVTGSADPDAGAALATLDGEAREAAQLAADRTAAVAGLERMASSLRTLTLRTRRDRGVRGVAAQDDPVDALFGELDLREAAASEADAAGRSPAPAQSRPG